MNRVRCYTNWYSSNISWDATIACSGVLQSGMALVLQVLSVCGCVATVVLATMGLVDCVKLLDDTRK